MEENFNKHLGNKLKLRRLALGLTQTKVAKAINVTFQQIQKYEKGTNGVSSIRLLQLSNYLKVPINYFFEDFSEYLINLENKLDKLVIKLTLLLKNRYTMFTRMYHVCHPSVLYHIMSPGGFLLLQKSG